MTTVLTPAARAAAALVAVIGWIGLGVQVDASIALTGSVGAALREMLRFFTALANLLSAVMFSAIALRQGWAARPRLIAGVAMAMALVGIVYGLLLQGLLDLSGGAKLADTLLHKVTTVLAPLWWLVFAPKGRIVWRDPPVWAVFPLAYFIYGLTRGALDGKYPYPFMNVSRIGWEQTLANGFAMAAAFMVAGYALVWLDRALGPKDLAA